MSALIDRTDGKGANGSQRTADLGICREKSERSLGRRSYSKMYLSHIENWESKMFEVKAIFAKSDRINNYVGEST